MKTFVVVWRFENGEEDIFFYRGRRPVKDSSIERKLQREADTKREVYILQHSTVPPKPQRFKELWK